jgi:hypothetical protein
MIGCKQGNDNEFSVQTSLSLNCFQLIITCEQYSKKQWSVWDFYISNIAICIEHTFLCVCITHFSSSSFASSFFFFCNSTWFSFGDYPSPQWLQFPTIVKQIVLKEVWVRDLSKTLPFPPGIYILWGVPQGWEKIELDPTGVTTLKGQSVLPIAQVISFLSLPLSEARYPWLPSIPWSSS